MLDKNIRAEKNEIIAGLMELYEADNRPWAVAFSGGKDSTALLQLVYEMMVAHPQRMKKNIFVLTNDTCVEAPNVSKYLDDTLRNISGHIKANGFPMKTIKVRPNPDESFWGKLIGKGYPSPTRWFSLFGTMNSILANRRSKSPGKLAGR